MRNVAFVCGWLLCGFALVGCKNEECEQKRFDVSNQWEHVVSAAGRRALSAAESGGSSEAWNAIKAQAELVHSSFATSQVTWDAASNGRAKIRAQFTPFASAEESRAFAGALKAAEQALDAYEQACR